MRFSARHRHGSRQPARLASRKWGLLVTALAAMLLASGSQATVQAVDAPDVVAESAIVIDAHSGEVLFDLHASEPRAMASLTKLFTALVALEILPLDAEVVVEAGDLVGEASMGLVAGDVVHLETLLHGVLLPSGNDAATTLARAAGGGSEAAFLERANERVHELGLQQTRLMNPHGLDAAGHVSSARDVAAVAMYALKHQPSIASAIHIPSYSGDEYMLYNTNRLLNTYPGLIGGKTGVTDAAGYCLMQVAEIDGRRVLVVLMGSTWESWYADAERLLDHGFQILSVPGRMPGGDSITFPQPEPVAQAALSAVTHAETGFSVSPASSESRIVSSPGLTATQGWSPWFWFGAVAVLVPSITFIALQLQKLCALIAHGSPQRSTARSSVARRAQPSRGFTPETQPFPLVTYAGGYQQAPLRRGRTTGGPPVRRASVERVRNIAPSFSGD